mmetsp:Transcript_7772/g.8917  ORF Transcript_7772/g.8917 Transcript_7772/m.8917 type:complete len:277 (+) Transcript_7772:367-1197(+)
MIENAIPGLQTTLPKTSSNEMAFQSLYPLSLESIKSAVVEKILQDVQTKPMLSAPLNPSVALQTPLWNGFTVAPTLLPQTFPIQDATLAALPGMTPVLPCSAMDLLSQSGQLALNPFLVNKLPVVTKPITTASRSTSRGKKRSYSRECSAPNCTKLARGRGLCKGHGGGRRCHKLHCTKSARSGSNFCTAHGGGRRCQAEGCTKGAEGSSFHCVSHGGGKRCQMDGCSKKDQGGGFCKAHGGGKRCSFKFHTGDRCTKIAQSRKSFCALHHQQQLL